jgi:hypothetical protein
MKELIITTLSLFLLSSFSVNAESNNLKPFRRYSNGAEYLDLNSRSNLCKGKIVEKGLICITKINLRNKLNQPIAFMHLRYKTGDIQSLVTIQAVKLVPSQNNIANIVTIRRFIEITKSEHPMLLVTIDNDGTISVDSTYGEFPEQFSPKEESMNLLKEYQEEIRKLVLSLK